MVKPVPDEPAQDHGVRMGSVGASAASKADADTMSLSPAIISFYAKEFQRFVDTLMDGYGPSVKNAVFHVDVSNPLTDGQNKLFKFWHTERKNKIIDLADIPAKSCYYKFDAGSNIAIIIDSADFSSAIQNGFFNQPFVFQFTNHKLVYDWESRRFLDAGSKDPIPKQKTERPRINFDVGETLKISAAQKAELDASLGYSAEDTHSETTEDALYEIEKQLSMVVDMLQKFRLEDEKAGNKKQTNLLIKMLKDRSLLQALSGSDMVSGHTTTDNVQRDTAERELKNKNDLSKEHLATTQTGWRAHENVLDAAELAAKALGAERYELIRDAIHEAVVEGLEIAPTGAKKQIPITVYEDDLAAIDELSKKTGITRADFYTQAVLKKLEALRYENSPQIK